MKVEAWNWSLRVFDHVDVHASDYAESVRFYETVLAALGIPRVAEVISIRRQSIDSRLRTLRRLDRRRLRGLHRQRFMVA